MHAASTKQVTINFVLVSNKNNLQKNDKPISIQNYLQHSIEGSHSTNFRAIPIFVRI